METLSLPIYNLEGKETDSLKLDAAIFPEKVNTALIYQAINAYRANQRTGLAATKTRGEVSGGGRKPWKQKGTGRARVGSTRSPLWRHGGVIFGPHPRDFSYVLPKKIKIAALKSALLAKLKENNLIVLNEFTLEKPKTRDAIKVLSQIKIIPHKKDSRVLLLLDKVDLNLMKALRNISFLKFNLAKDTHAYEIIVHEKVVITKNGLDDLTKRLKSI